MTRPPTAAWLCQRALLLGFAGLTGCSAGGPPPAPTVESVTSAPTEAPTVTPQEATRTERFPGVLSIWLTWGPSGISSVNDLIESFQAEYPGATFAVAYVPPDELRPTLEQAATAGDLPLLFIGPSSWGPELFEAGMVRDLADQPIGQIKPIVHSLAWSQVNFQDHVLGLPIRLNGRVLYRNRVLSPVPAATLEGLVESSRGFRGTAAVGMNLDFGYSTIVPMAAACGGQLVQPGSPPDLQDPLGPCWLAVLQELSRAGPVEFNSDRGRQAFQSGLAGWLIDSTESYESLATALGEGTVAVDPWPIYEATGESLAGYVWGDNLYFRAGMDPAELDFAWAFSTYLLSAESQQVLSSPVGAGNLPVHAGSFPLVGAYGQMYQALLGGIPTPLEPARPEFVDILERAARAVAVQGTPVDVALRRALEELGDV